MFFSMLMTRMSGQFSSVMPKNSMTRLLSSTSQSTKTKSNLPCFILFDLVSTKLTTADLEFLGGGGVVGHDGVEVGGGLGGEEEIVLFQITTEDLWRGLVGELVDKGQLLLLDELDQGLGSLTVEVDASLIELKIKFH